MANYWRTIADGDWSDPIWECVDEPALQGGPTVNDLIEIRHNVTFDADTVGIAADGQLTVQAGAVLHTNTSRVIQIGPTSVGMYVYGTVLAKEVWCSSKLEVVGGYVEAAVYDDSLNYGKPGVIIKTGGVLVIPADAIDCEWSCGAGHIDAGGTLIVHGVLYQYGGGSPFTMAGNLDVTGNAELYMDPAATARVRVFGNLHLDSDQAQEWRGQYEVYGFLSLITAMPTPPATRIRLMRREASIQWGYPGIAGRIVCSDVQPRRQPCLM